MRFKTVQQVAEWRLCVGCGACAYVCPEKNISLVNNIDDGIRPVLDAHCMTCGKCVKVCPGHEVTKHCPNDDIGKLSRLRECWGTVLEVWEGYASDADIRFNGSSGGLVSALALYCLEKEGMQAVLHSGTDVENPLFNRTVLSRDRADIISAAGSRYSPASPCEGLSMIESEPNVSVFIGKPCDVTGLRKAQALMPELSKKVGVAIGIFCAGTPSTRGTIDLLKKLNITADNLHALRYRGQGWPGLFVAHEKKSESKKSLSYREAWGFIQKYRPYRCYLCPDGTSELSDISCGDPWYREFKESEPGRSLIIARTERGREILHAAAEAGYVVLERVDPKIIKRSQKNLFDKRGAIWGRLLTMRVFAIPAPRLRGFSLFKSWLKIPSKEKAASLIGTAKRIIKRKYYKRNYGCFQRWPRKTDNEELKNRG